MSKYELHLRVQAAMDRARDIGAAEIIELLQPVVSSGKNKKQVTVRTLRRISRVNLINRAGRK